MFQEKTVRYIFKLLDSRKNTHRQRIELGHRQRTLQSCRVVVVEEYIERKDKRRNNEAAPRARRILMNPLSLSLCQWYDTQTAVAGHWSGQRIAFNSATQSPLRFLLNYVLITLIFLPLLCRSFPFVIVVPLSLPLFHVPMLFCAMLSPVVKRSPSMTDPLNTS